MILFPSIHIKDGVVARLTHGGDLEQADVLHHDPAARAMEFEAQGFPWLHVVDLNGAFDGRSANVAVIESIIHAVKIPVQLSGGIRTLADIEEWLNKGVERVVLASLALQNPELTREACRRFPGRIAIKVDSRGGRVATTGWSSSTSSVKALDLALRVEEAGAAAVIYADINSGGALGEVNVEAIIDLAFALTVPVIASGGVQSLQDLAELKDSARAGVAGLILGRALYNGAINANDALQLAVS